MKVSNILPNYICKSINYRLMTIAFPSSTVTIVRQSFGLITTRFTNKNPRFAFLNLNTEERSLFDFAKFADFSFHKLVNFPLNK